MEPRLETLRKISQDLNASIERSIEGLSSPMGELVDAVRLDTEQAERLMNIESKRIYLPKVLLTRSTQLKEKSLFDKRAERHSSSTYSERKQSRALQRSCGLTIPY